MMELALSLHEALLNFLFVAKKRDICNKSGYFKTRKQRDYSIFSYFPESQGLFCRNRQIVSFSDKTSEPMDLHDNLP